MKNKFLLMAVISALAALVIVPSTMAEEDTQESTEVSANVASGDFTLTATGVYGLPIQLSSVSVDSAAQTASAYPSATATGMTDLTFDSGSYFELTDYMADTAAAQGATVKIFMSDDFTYSGTAGGQAIPLENLLYTMSANDTTGAAEQPVCHLDTYTNGCSVVTSLTAPSVLTATDFFAAENFTSSTFMNVMDASMQNILRTSLSAPYVVRFGLERLDLIVPANSAQGSYSSTIFLVATDI